MKKIIPSVFHACIDYSIVIILLTGPAVFIKDSSIEAKCMSLVTGVLLALLNFFTNYEGGIVRIINIKIHLLIDKVIGVFVMIMPLFLEYSGQSFLTHIFMGMMLLALGILTSSDDSTKFFAN